MKYKELEEEGRQDKELHEEQEAANRPVDNVTDAMAVLTELATSPRAKSAIAYIQRVIDALNERIRRDMNITSSEHEALDQIASGKVAGPLDINNPEKAFSSPQESNVEDVFNAIATEMRNNSIHGSLDLGSDQVAADGIRKAIQDAMNQGFEFTPEVITWMCWPDEDEHVKPASLENAPVAVSILDKWLNTYYGGDAPEEGTDLSVA